MKWFRLFILGENHGYEGKEAREEGGYEENC